MQPSIPITSDKLLTRKEFARRLGICSHTIRRYERAGKITSIKFSSRMIRYRESELERFIATAMAETPEEFYQDLRPIC